MSESPHLEKAWFELDKHKPVRKCVCLCGNIFKSQAHELPCLATRTVKNKQGQPILSKKGIEEIETFTIIRMHVKKPCPKCLSPWIKSFEKESE